MDKLQKLNSLLAQVDARMKHTGGAPTAMAEETSVTEMPKRTTKPSYELYHTSYTSAVNAALEYAQKLGYTYDPEETATKIGSGPRKPNEGVTNRFDITLYKNNVPQKKMLHMQIYGMGERYELNAYVS